MKRHPGNPLKRVLGLLSALVAFAGAAAHAAEPIRIGAPWIFTGPGAFTGESSKLAVEALVGEINAAGGIGGRRVEMVYYDTEGKPDVAIRVVNRLIKSDHVDAILGPIASWEVGAVKPVLESSGMPTMLLSSARTFVDPPSRCIFKIPPDDQAVVARLYETLKTLGLSRVALVTSHDAYGDSGQKELIAQAPANGIEIVFDEKFSMEDTDLAPLLNKIKRTKAQVVVNWSSTRAPIVLTNAYKQVGLEIPLFHGAAAISDSVLKGVGANGDGMYAVGSKFDAADELPGSDPQRAPLLKFRESFRKTQGKDANQFAGNAYDGLQVLKLAIERAGGTEPAKVCAAIAAIGTYAGVGGVYTFTPQDHAGLGKDAVIAYRVQGGRWRVAR